ncbi:hypothetical protein GOP47_0028358 [Adiantum capillus-veneris]|nr:hypothetical protein GOP47_0028358 [Adiantum capillus-veneris]
MFGVESRLVPCCPPLSLQRAADEVQFRREDIAVLLRSRPSFLGKVEPRDLFLWNSMIAGYSQCGLRKQAFTLLKEMQQQGITPNQVTYIHVLAACSSPEDLEDGKYAHSGLLETGLDCDFTVGTALINMYGKCGAPHLARAAFNNITQHDVISWTTMIAAHSSHGQGNEAFELFESFYHIFQPTQVTIVSVLSACADIKHGCTVHMCAVQYGYDTNVIAGTALLNMYGSHAGLVDKCYELFLLILGNCQVKPRLDHLTCVVGLLGRSGRLEDAENLVLKTALQHDSAIWLTLLGACSTHGDVSRSERIADIIFELDPNHETAYIVLANLYVATGRLNDWMKLEEVMLARGLDVGRE